MMAPTSTSASPATPTEVHHGIPRCLLRLRDRADAHAELDGEGIQRWLDYECEALRWGVDPDVTRDELAAMIEASTVEMAREEHRAGHAEDFRRWGRMGGLETLRRYGRPWFAALARRRWGKIDAETLAGDLARLAGTVGARL